MLTMKYFCSSVTLIAGSVISTAAYAADMEHGKMLYENHCVSCHSSAVFTREKRMVNNFTELRERIRQCELSNDLTWFDEDIDAVVNYLNTNFYKFETE
jgi:hypothetical protein